MRRDAWRIFREQSLEPAQARLSLVFPAYESLYDGKLSTMPHDYLNAAGHRHSGPCAARGFGVLFCSSLKQLLGTISRLPPRDLSGLRGLLRFSGAQLVDSQYCNGRGKALIFS